MFHYNFPVHRKPNTDTSDYQGLGTPDPHPTGHSLFKLGKRHSARSAGIGEAFKPRRDVDAITEEVVPLGHNIAEINADTKPHPAVFTDIHQGIDSWHWQV
jgi:hypothetical protein